MKIIITNYKEFEHVDDVPHHDITKYVVKFQDGLKLLFTGDIDEVKLETVKVDTCINIHEKKEYLLNGLKKYIQKNIDDKIVFVFELVNFENGKDFFEDQAKLDNYLNNKGLEYAIMDVIYDMENLSDYSTSVEFEFYNKLYRL